MNLTGGISDYFIVYASGVVVSFTPCVYPILPITASFIAGANTQGTKLMGLIISLIYVLGLAATYCLLALFAALTGQIFGQFQNSPIVFLIVANVFLFFALVMLDVIPLPNVGLDIHNKIKPKNFWTVFLFGMASGLIVGPCTAPVLSALLVYVGLKQNILHGTSLLFVFAYGVGTSLILIGTFSSLLAHLPKSGRWLIRIKHGSGLILLIAAEYFLIKAGGLM
ncbi:MAG: hypothetical protein A2787_04640 [Omnitrophica WOR_2 bacterium RIFCSPHIGHO2_01_FULL_48_9]|uniref:Cytochrome C biogenesis protein transmembrane domain-containing protein n=1 Tax=Candidatus Sungbacteria bacterium RIFCSPHIGHO2_02_FULL_47_11 TaxID=1802270 RepID=A0A1G2KFC0_9BACT|nr:MAG: hypothetical protein A2787_04640 [Omnitrophica WOR_2 bacterium RIFCSPHIGHO2_01_FULL_48_9]OGZ98152.1 MAG: hypothetical protein A3C07_05010 [Candidatus Sungbacteria bacterium RIFCSPHIGHO2_02_FULL_47_11]